MDKQKTLVPYGTYVLVWFGLMALTGLTITVANLHLGNFSVLTAILIAAIKGTLVLMIFMNLKYEARLFKIMLLLAVATLAVIMVLTFTDISFR